MLLDRGWLGYSRAMAGADDKRDPIARFAKLFERAKRDEPFDATAIALATATPSGQPSVRIVLLKKVDERGFSFFTNYGSRKARELEANPRAAFSCYWPASQLQTRVEGAVERLPPEESDAYFATRPRGSQLAALVSRQSEPLESHAALMKRYLKLQYQHGEDDIARPDFWGGYLLTPERIEFWSNRQYRLHDRLAYVRDGDGWTEMRLYP